jgi:hypothetical protein
MRPPLCARPYAPAKKTAWYNNPNANAAKSHLKIEEAPRCGYFIEKVLRCQEGKRIRAGGLVGYVRDLQSDILTTLTPSVRMVARPRWPKGWIVIVIFIPGDFDDE